MPHRLSHRGGRVNYEDHPLPIDVAEPDPDDLGDVQMLGYVLVLLSAVICAGVWWFFL